MVVGFTQHLIMLHIKEKMTDYKELIAKANRSNFLKTFSSLMLVVAVAFFTSPVFAQKNKDSIISVYSAPDDTYNKILDYSRPGKYHQLLADIVGKWTFKGRHFGWVDSATSKVDLEYSGTAVRESFANGRYFVVNVTSDGTLEMPIKDGKMQVTKFHGIDIEGYDNVKKKFVISSIGNHLYSSIVVSEGTYDSTTKTITFDSEFEPIPGMKTKDHLLFIFIDDDHYKYEYYQEDEGKYRKGSEIDFTRVKGK
jgi:hypothetical protein